MKHVCQLCCIATAFFLILCICSPVSAANSVSIGAGPGSGTGYGGESVGKENASLQDPVMVRDQDQVRVNECSTDEACNATRLRTMVSERNQVYLAVSGDSLSPGNSTKVAVYAFRAAAPLTGAHAPELIRLAEEINGSVQNEEQNEVQIRSQNSFMTFLFGGDHASADAILQYTVQNRVRTEEMNRLIDECGCDEETAALLREQVQAMEQEQERFEMLAAAEKEKRGIFGIFG